MNGPRVRTRATVVTLPEERHEFPTFANRYLLYRRPVFPKRLLGASSIAWVPFPHAMCSSTSHLPLTLDLIVLPQVQHLYNRQQHLCRPWQS